MRLGLAALILCTCCVWFGQGDDDVGPPYIYGNRKVIWNPRFLNPETDPDFNDFDKSGWNVAAGGSGEYIHHKIAALVVFADTGKVDMNFEGMIFVEGRSNDFIETGNTTFEYDYPGKMCIQQSAQLIGVDILTPSIPTLPNCVGNCWEYRSPFTAVRYGHIFISDMYFSLPFNNDPGMVRSILIAPRLFWDYDGIPFDNMTLKIPNVQALTADYRPDRIKLASPLPTSIEANTPFTVQLKMVNSDDNVITTSFNSGLEIMAQVAYTHKWFERIGGLWLVDTDAVLNGPDVVTSVINDRVIFTRFVGGYANITIQIEDVHPNLELNFTSKWPLRPYRRFPTNEINPYKSGGLSVDYSTFQTFGNHLTHPDSNVTHVKYQHFEGQPNYFRGSLIANITITPQVAVALRIIEGPTWKLFQFVNREFKGPLQIEAIDANGRRVTSGPDSNLTVIPSCDNNLIEFSGDAIITLYRGHATWKGSLVTMSTTDIHLKFTTEATNGSIESNNTKSFTVIGSTFLVNNFISDTEWDVFEAIKAFLQYDKYGPLNNKILMQTFMHVKTVAELEQNFDDAETQVQVWQYYGIGKGKIFKVNGEPVPPESKEVIPFKNDCDSFGEIKSRSNQKEEFSCPDVMCIKTFKSYQALTRHTDLEAHEYEKKTSKMESVKDKWVERYLEGDCEGRRTDNNNLHSSHQDQQKVKKPLKMGWAIPVRTTRRLTKRQKVFLNRVFHDGEKSGNKVSAESAHNQMRKLFKTKDFLPVSTIKSYFSRRAAAVRKGDVFSHEDIEELSSDEEDSNQEEDGNESSNGNESRNSGSEQSGASDCEESESSDSEGSDSSDNEKSGSGDEENNNERKHAIAVVSGAVNGVNILPDEWLAVKYPRGWYVGQYIEYDKEDDLIQIHFLKRVSSSYSNRFIWPELEINGREDKAYVEESAIFYRFSEPVIGKRDVLMFDSDELKEVEDEYKLWKNR